MGLALLYGVVSMMLGVIVNVPPAYDEQVARVPKTGEQEKRRVQAG